MCILYYLYTYYIILCICGSGFCRILESCSHARTEIDNKACCSIKVHESSYVVIFLFYERYHAIIYVYVYYNWFYILLNIILELNKLEYYFFSAQVLGLNKYTAILIDNKLITNIIYYLAVIINISF